MRAARARTKTGTRRIVGNSGGVIFFIIRFASIFCLFLMLSLMARAVKSFLIVEVVCEGRFFVGVYMCGSRAGFMCGEIVQRGGVQ